MSAPEPPTIALEQLAACADPSAAETALRGALGPTLAPAAAWRVEVQLRARADDAKRPLEATGDIVDAAGVTVARRAIAGGECIGIARAIGVWASVVLDAEVDRARQSPPPAGATPPPVLAWPAPQPPPEKPSPEASLFLVHEPEERQLEVGAASYLMGGTGAGMVAGGGLFVVSEAGAGWFLRPAIALGRTFTDVVPTTEAYTTVGSARFDACKRMPGNYLENRGIQLDFCGGAEVGFVRADAQATTSPSARGAPASTVPLFAVGPSLNLRGELASALSVVIRGVAEWNVVRGSGASGEVDSSVIIGRAEVGLSWRLR